MGESTVNWLKEHYRLTRIPQIGDAANELERLTTEVSRYYEAARKTLSEFNAADEHHSAACTNWSALENSRHQCGLCDLRDAVSGRRGSDNE